MELHAHTSVYVLNLSTAASWIYSMKSNNSLSPSAMELVAVSGCRSLDTDISILLVLWYLG